MLSDEELLALYHKPDWPGSFSGVRVFKMFLYTDFNEDVSEKRILDLLKQDANYLIHQRKQRKYPLRAYDVQAFGELVMLDLAYMFPVMGFKYFLLFIDVFSRHIYCEPLKKKTAAQVGVAIEKIIGQMHTPIQKLQTDQGTEFIGNKALFKKHNIRFTTKHLTHKASFSEQAIYLVKRKLYRMMREKMDDKWPNYLQKVVDGLNEIPRKKLGFVAPSEINSLADGAKVYQARQNVGVKVYKEPDFHTQNANQEYYENSLSKFQIGTFVYLDNKTSSFTKSFDTQVRFGKYLGDIELVLNALMFFNAT